MWHQVQEQREPVSPKQFAELKVEQTQKQKDFIEKAIKRANSCLLEIAGGITPSPYYGRHKGSGGDYIKQFEEYCAWLESEYAQETFDLIPNLIHLELCHFDAIDPQSVYDELLQRFVVAGWGENSRVHKRAGPENMVWISLESLEENDEDDEEDPDKCVPMISSKHIPEMEDHRVYFWLRRYKVPALQPLRLYSNADRRSLLLAFVIETETKEEIESGEVKNGEDYCIPTVEQVRSMSRDQLMHWFRVFDIHSTIPIKGCRENRLRRHLISYLRETEEKEEE